MFCISLATWLVYGWPHVLHKSGHMFPFTWCWLPAAGPVIPSIYPMPAAGFQVGHPFPLPSAGYRLPGQSFITFTWRWLPATGPVQCWLPAAELDFMWLSIYGYPYMDIWLQASGSVFWLQLPSSSYLARISDRYLPPSFALRGVWGLNSKHPGPKHL